MPSSLAGYQNGTTIGTTAKTSETKKAPRFAGLSFIAGERFVLIGDHSVLVERVVPWPVKLARARYRALNRQQAGCRRSRFLIETEPP
jgi:hypothetical protein